MHTAAFLCAVLSFAKCDSKCAISVEVCHLLLLAWGQGAQSLGVSAKNGIINATFRSKHWLNHSADVSRTEKQ